MDVDAKLIDNIVDKFNKSSWGFNQRFVSMGVGKVTKAGVQLYIPESPPCYHAVRRHKVKSPEFLAFPILQGGLWSTSRLTKVAKFFINYIVSESPYESVYLTKDVEQIWNSKITLVDTEQPSNMCISAAIALRDLWSNPRMAVQFYELCKHSDMPKDLAYFLTYCTTTRTSDGTSNLEIPGWSEGVKEVSVGKLGVTSHAAFNPHNFKFEDLKSFLEHSPPYLKSSFKSSSNYYGLQLTFLNQKGTQHLESKFDDYSVASSIANENCGSSDPKSVMKFIQDNYIPYKESIKPSAALVFGKVLSSVRAKKSPSYEEFFDSIKGLNNFYPQLLKEVYK